ncbi:MAG: GIY-YIG nuclease family protein, partial [Candidatus Omnitrophica bacterium]|nr:GIY-YIG nuclease family protein [Candidatus Omnitrophota bacterium]
LCSVRLSRMLYKQEKKHNLSSIIERFGLQCKNRHRALDDARAVWDFMRISDKQLPEGLMQKALKQLLKTPTFPAHVPKEMIDHLPESPGIYQFFDQTGMPLYIGKSTNIRQRVFSHFSSDNGSTKEMRLCQQVQSITFQETAGELGALLLEAHLVKQKLPIYNRRLRRTWQLTALREVHNERGYLQLSLEDLKTIQAEDLRELYALFRTRKDAKRYLEESARTLKLCRPLLGLEQHGKNCFHYQIKQCPGACYGEADVHDYNLRVKAALQKYKIMSWPFDGPVLIDEPYVGENRGEVFIIDRWCIKKSFRYEDDIHCEFLPADYTFDLDAYKIIYNYMRKHPERIKQIHPERLVEIGDGAFI